MRVQDLLGLRRPPVAIGFFDVPPAGMGRWQGGAVPSRCSYWRSAMEGQAFYTTPEDHSACAVGSFTHGAELPAERANELQAAQGFREPERYLEVTHLPQLHSLSDTPAVVAYAPVEQATFQPAMIVVTATPAQTMHLFEAAMRADAASSRDGVVVRPGCALLAMAGHRQSVCLSFGCRHNRKFTELRDDELHFCAPASRWNELLVRLAGVLSE